MAGNTAPLVNAVPWPNTKVGLPTSHNELLNPVVDLLSKILLPGKPLNHSVGVLPLIRIGVAAALASASLTGVPLGL